MFFCKVLVNIGKFFLEFKTRATIYINDHSYGGRTKTDNAIISSMQRMKSVDEGETYLVALKDLSLLRGMQDSKPRTKSDAICYTYQKKGKKRVMQCVIEHQTL